MEAKRNNNIKLIAMKKIGIMYVTLISVLIAILTVEALNVLTFVSLGIGIVCSFYIDKHRKEYDELFDEKFGKYFND